MQSTLYSKIRALTRVATPENETDLLELAQGCTTAQLEKMIRAYRLGSREDEVEAERRRHRMRSLSVFPDEDGMYLVRGRLPAEVGVLLMRAVEAAGDALFREK
ncbi:MAG: 13E12 repeat family protein, partial [marine benthic group bacterium]|nr:13E12 repeat family protein [Gemmatimonadota bacterium]